MLAAVPAELKGGQSGTVFFLFVLAAEALFLLRKGNPDRMLVFFAVLLAWEITASWLHVTNPILLPGPEAVFGVFVSHRKLMLRGIFSSLELLLIGFGFAFVIGIPLGILAGRSRRFTDFLLPAAKMISSVPPIIYTPYVVALMPSFRSASAFVLIMGLFWPLVMNVLLSVKKMNRRYLDTAAGMGVKPVPMFFEILLPYVLPGVIKSLHVSLSTSFMLLTMAEMMGASSGLGFFIKNYADYGNYTCVLAGIILSAAVILLINLGLTELEKKVADRGYAV